MTRRWRFAIGLALACVLAFIIGMQLPKAHADEDRVYVSESVDDSRQIRNRIADRLDPKDEIQVAITGKGETAPVENTSVVFLYAEGKDVTVIGNDWVPQVFLDERLDRIDNVTRRPVDQIIKMIDEIHKWQADNPRRTQAPPPPPGESNTRVFINGVPCEESPNCSVNGTPGVPPPPSTVPTNDQRAQPGESFRFTPKWYIGIASGAGVIALGVVWFLLHRRLVRRRAQWKEVAARAEEQADWSLDKYNIQRTID
jgi:hypothetical protein